MTFKSLYTINTEFIKLFLDKSISLAVENDSRNFPHIPIEYSGNTYNFLFRFFNRSGHAEDLKEVYPVIVLQDFVPTVDESRIWGDSWHQGYYDGSTETAEKVYRPTPMKHRYQVSFVAENKKEYDASVDWFYSVFPQQAEKFLKFNSIQITDDCILTNSVPYTVNATDMPRDDNKFEFMAEFELSSYIYFSYKEYSFDEDGNLVGGNFGETIETITNSVITKSFNNV